MDKPTGWAILFCPYCGQRGEPHFFIQFHIPGCRPEGRIHDVE